MKASILFLSLLLAACANPYSQFYRGIPDARVRPGYIATTEEVKIYSTSDFGRDRKALMQKGYMPVGDSSFNAGANTVTEAQLREQASKIGAHLVLVSSKFTHAVSGAIPLTLPDTTTSYSSGSATAYGSGGSVTAYGSSTTTTYGTQTTYIPYTVNRSDFNAIYFVKVKPKIGFIAEPLNDETKRMLQSNSGVRVDIVVEGSPAFEANVLPGDVLVSFGGESVRSIEHYQELLKALSGETVEVVLNRDGRPLKLILQVNKR
ncbi:MAG: PDZ domain-containing protein [Candidatus Nitricoxidivorans perseverans]|uniref:PDZ domain-containing protein n=1 Tax=Candidatus Nitricoxidivorans perseverans TaxID=2975601 RepID=A0AA49FJK9_9PROT|nr:MAG: PDZ domain-containing protein [Candidatus Nitricoxidivorans perseverans]